MSGPASSGVHLQPVPTALRPHLRRLVGFRLDAPERGRDLEPAGVAVPIILVLDGGFALHDGARSRPLLRSFTAGIHDRPVEIGYPSAAACVQLDLSPLAARRLLGPAFADAAGETVDLRDLAPSLAAELEDRAAAAPDWPSRAAAAAATLARALAAAPEPPRLAARALAEMAARPHEARTALLADRLGVSRQTLSDVLRRETGLPPKRLARVIRFETALARLRSADAPPLAALAHDLGYADQAHLTREFRAFAGRPPTALA